MKVWELILGSFLFLLSAVFFGCGIYVISAASGDFFLIIATLAALLWLLGFVCFMGVLGLFDRLDQFFDLLGKLIDPLVQLLNKDIGKKKSK